MANIRGRVLEVSQSGDTKYALLYNFKVDRAELRGSHKRWLEDNVLIPARGRTRPSWAVLPEECHVWLRGHASRTAEFWHNLLLSMSRANAVKAYLETELASRSTPVVLNVNTGWHGEIRAWIEGRPDNVEHPLDRAVDIAFRFVTPTIGSVVGPPPTLSAI